MDKLPVEITWPRTSGEIIEVYHKYLESLGELGDLMPTRENAHRFAVNVLIPAWMRREPILFAYLGSDVVGATFTTMPTDGFEYRVPTAFGHGTWVHPDYRKRGVAGQLIKHVRALLRAAGIKRQAGMAHILNNVSLDAFKKMGFSPHGVIVTASL